MKIIYLTSALKKSDFFEFQKHWIKPLNPSNQNFHEKMIRALSNFAEVEVFSIRSLNKNLCNIKRLSKTSSLDNNCKWNYLKIVSNKYINVLSLEKQFDKIAKNLRNEKAIVLVDTINAKTVKLASKIQKMAKLPIVGICTDSPKNITGANESYINYLLKTSSNFDGYITLTEGLNNLYNTSQKSSLLLEGIVENNSITSDIDNNQYIFFGGAMLERYGVYNLIEAFKQIKENIQLLICGHHYDEDKLFEAIKDDPRIKFLGILNVDEVIELESHALACINPRPYDEELDKYSIPSKTIEYLASGSITISVKNTKLESLFNNEIIWSPSGQPDDLKVAIQKVIEMNEKERKNLVTNAQDKVQKLYSIDAVSRKLEEYLRQFAK